jgi:hypothetical protein
MIWRIARRRPLPVDPNVWSSVVGRLPFLAGLEPHDDHRLRELVAAFLTAKTFTGAAGLTVDDDMRILVAAQACLPVLNLGLGHYDDFVEIVMYPSAFAVRRQVADDEGLVHEFDDVLSGEAMDGGPVVLAWDDADGQRAADRTNVVIHEFVHKLDLADGLADGCPPMPARHRAAWTDTLGAAYDRFVAAVEAVERRIPRHVDPESPDADRFFDDLPLDPYAATDEVEFFAVAAESFFVDPHRLGSAAAFPDLYAMLSTYFRQDPLRRLSPP